ncbi:MAG: M20 family metallo-hydrolase [Pseudomonadota bacterium]
MSLAQKLMSRIDSYADQIVEAQRLLVAIPALGPDNGGQGEMDKALLVEKWLKEMNLRVERVDAPDARVESGLRPNLIATMPGGEGPARWALSHLDVVPTGPADQWTSDPWQLRVEGGKLYGRGVLDNHAGVVASLFALKALIEEGMTPPGTVGLIMVSDEETGSLYGLDHVLSKRPELIAARDLVVIPDAGEEDGLFIEVAEKSILWLKVEVTGKQVHGSTPDKGVNALYASARMMVAVREMYDRFGGDDPIFVPPTSTFEPTRKEAGVPNINTIPGKDVFYIDCRVLPEVNLDEVDAAFFQRFQEIAKEEGVQVKISHEQRLQSPPATPAEAPVVQALAKAIETVKGQPAKAGGIGGGTVAAFFRKRGLPAAVWCTWPPTPHMPDEWCDLNGLLDDTKVFALVFAGL